MLQEIVKTQRYSHRSDAKTRPHQQNNQEL